MKASESMIEKIQDYGMYIRDPNMDSFTQYAAKQELYKILWEVEKQLNSCPKFLGEDDWIVSKRG